MKKIYVIPRQEWGYKKGKVYFMCCYGSIKATNTDSGEWNGDTHVEMLKVLHQSLLECAKNSSNMKGQL